MREKSEKPSELSFVSTIAEASWLVKRIAEPCPAGDSTRAAIKRSWERIAGWSYNRVKDIWYADARIAVDENEVEYLKRIAAMAKQRLEEQEARDEFRALRERIARIEAKLAQEDADFHSPQIDALQRSIGGPRGPGSPMGE